MTRSEIMVRSVLTKTRIPGHDYCVNPYVGCEHACRYCYASFMRRFTGHQEPWGDFVDAKVNAVEVLRRQLRRARPGSVLVGTVTDPYQPAEKGHRLTRGCLEALLERQFPVSVLTRSPLCVRDVDLFHRFDDISVGLSITTDDEQVKTLFEPRAPSIASRIDALATLHRARIPTYAFIGPLLPMDPRRLVERIGDAADEILIDRLNYVGQVKSTYRRHRLEEYLSDEWFDRCAAELCRGFQERGVPASVLFASG